MTNCNYICHVGKKNEKDLSISLHAFQNISSEIWIKMCGVKGNTLEGPTLTQEEMREARLKRFTNLVHSE